MTWLHLLASLSPVLPSDSSLPSTPLALPPLLMPATYFHPDIHAVLEQWTHLRCAPAFAPAGYPTRSSPAREVPSSTLPHRLPKGMGEQQGSLI